MSDIFEMARIQAESERRFDLVLEKCRAYDEFVNALLHWPPEKGLRQITDDAMGKSFGVASPRLTDLVYRTLTFMAVALDSESKPKRFAYAITKVSTQMARELADRELKDTCLYLVGESRTDLQNKILEIAPHVKDFAFFRHDGDAEMWIEWPTGTDFHGNAG